MLRPLQSGSLLLLVPAAAPQLFRNELSLIFCRSNSEGVIFNIQDESDFQSRVLKSTKPVIADFHATWCGPCKVLGPRLQKAVNKTNGTVLLAKIDVDENDELSERYSITAVPTVIGFSNGKKQDQFSGVIDEDVLDDFVDKLKGPSL